jgi:PAS domain S-box-containing protein
MNKIATELLLLTANLSQLKNRERIIQLFAESIQSIFHNYKFHWEIEEHAITGYSIPVCTRMKTYGYLHFDRAFQLFHEQYSLFQNATQLLAIVLERLEQEELLNDQKAHLQYLVEDQTNHLIEKQDELNEMNEEFATINEELVETNKTLLHLNEQLHLEIEERKRIEEKLRTTDKIFTHSVDMLCIAGYDGYFKVLNPSWSKTLGWSTEELLSKPWLAFVHPDDVEATKNVKSSVEKGRELYQFENRYICKDGNVKWLSWSSFPYPEEGIMFSVARDVTSKKKIQEELHQSRKNFQITIDESPLGIRIVSKKGKTVYTNQTLLNLFGYDSMAELNNTHTSKKYTPESYEQHLQRKELRKKNEYTPPLYEISIVRKNLEVHHLQVIRKEVIWNETNQSMVIYQDITERKEAEIKLHDSKHLLTQSQRISNIGSYTLDIENGIWTGSTVLDEMFELDASDNHSVAGWLAVIHPEDREMMGEYFAKEVIESKERFDKVYRIQPLKSRKICWVHGIGELEFDEAGKPIRMIGTIQDITYRVNAEEKLRILTRAIDQSPDSIVITNIRAEIEYVNPVIEKLSGYTREELIGKNPRIFSSGNKSKEEYNELWKTITSGKSWQGEFQNKRKNGELYWESATISPVFNNEGKITHYLAIREDITQQKKLNQDLIEAKDRAEESDRLKSSFLANMSHEIRTPMNSIMGFASLLPEEESKDLLSKYAQIIVQNSEQLVSLIDGIVMYSKLQTHLFSFRPTLFNVQKLIEDIHQSFNLPIFQENVKLVIDLTLSENVSIFSDYDKLRQIITNLVSNAFKYTIRGEIMVGCSLNERWVNFYVKDTGIGIPEKDIEHVFDRFFRGSNIDQSNSRGTGLGLCIVKELVEMIKGEIHVESELGNGTIFFFSIPNL